MPYDDEPAGEGLDGIDLLIEMFALDQAAAILSAAQSQSCAAKQKGQEEYGTEGSHDKGVKRQ